MLTKKFVVLFLIFIFTIFFLKASFSTTFNNKDCLRCHNDPKLVMSDQRGRLESITVDSLLFARTLHGVHLLCVDCHIDADTTAHPNTGYTDVNCLACHSNLTGFYPPNSKETLQKKGLKIPDKKMVGEKYLQSSHGQALLNGDPDAPQCYDCHTQHYVKPKVDPKSSIHPLNLARVCMPCHEEGIEPAGFMNRLASFKIEGHRKENLAEKYVESNCQGCHYGDAAHGEDAPVDLTCPRCHISKQASKKVIFRPLHTNAPSDKQPIPHITASLYWILSPFAVGGALIFIGVILFKKYRIKDEVLLKLFPPPSEN